MLTREEILAKKIIYQQLTISLFLPWLLLHWAMRGRVTFIYVFVLLGARLVTFNPLIGPSLMSVLDISPWVSQWKSLSNRRNLEEMHGVDWACVKARVVSQQFFFWGRCYSGYVDNSRRDLHNSSYHTKAEFNNCFNIHSKILSS